MTTRQHTNRRYWDIEAVSLFVPYLLGFLAIYLLPFIVMLFIAVKDPTGGFTLGNYASVLGNEAFQLSIWNLLCFLALGLPALMVFSYAVALTIHFMKTPRWAKLLLVLPIALPSGASIGFFKNLFGASYDSMLYGPLSLLVIILIFIWKYTGYNLLIFLSGFKLMRSSVIDSAKIDGANFSQIIWHIILPLSAPYILFAGVVSVVNSFKIFKEIYILQGNYPNTRLYMFQHYVNNKFTDMAISELSAAAALFALVIISGAMIAIHYDRVQKRRLGGKA